ncbi:hypothetical protein F4782DRAFT_176923 [Xylaria castorea]|nr:hypothetical protein F4782DRAFT_176923 [Xylaria castorea]
MHAIDTCCCAKGSRTISRTLYDYIQDLFACICLCASWYYKFSQITDEMSESKPRPLFIYGTLHALPLLAWASTGDASNISAVSKLIQLATVYGYI